MFAADAAPGLLPLASATLGSSEAASSLTDGVFTIPAATLILWRFAGFGVDVLLPSGEVVALLLRALEDHSIPSSLVSWLHDAKC